MNLFLDTRRLTQAREDHLTCFIAATLEVDPAFRTAYESLVLQRLQKDGRPPRIVSVQTQTHFAEQHSVPDMVLDLADGRRVLCEHKIDAPETLHVTSDGRTVKQLERYLTVPGIAGLAYFRSSPVTVPENVLSHSLYLRPQTAAHFVWHDLFAPLDRGESDLVRWLIKGFEHLGFTPPEPHVGALWPNDADGVPQNQRNFGKLWQKTRAHLEPTWSMHQDQRGCELYLNPRTASLATRMYVSPIAQGGTLLRTRIDTDEAHLELVRRRIAGVCDRLPATPEVSVTEKPDGRVYVDLLAPLRAMLEGADTVAEQEERLYAQVVPVAEVLTTGQPKDLDTPSGRSSRPDEESAKAVQDGSDLPAGRLWPGTSEAVQQNQRAFAKLWDRTCARLEAAWAIRRDQRGCELYLKPKSAAHARKIYISPIAKGSTLLRTRIDVPNGDKAQIKERFAAVATQLPIQPTVKIGTQGDRTFVDLLVPLGDVLREADTEALRSQRLHDQVVPIVESVSGS